MHEGCRQWIENFPIHFFQCVGGAEKFSALCSQQKRAKTQRQAQTYRKTCKTENAGEKALMVPRNFLLPTTVLGQTTYTRFTVHNTKQKQSVHLRHRRHHSCTPSPHQRNTITKNASTFTFFKVTQTCTKKTTNHKTYNQNIRAH